MRCSRQETNCAIATKTRHTPRGAANRLAALVGLGLCLGASQASADTTTRGRPQSASAPAARGAGAARTGEAGVANREKRNLIVAGATTLGAFWTASAISASFLALESTPDASCPHQGTVMRRRASRQTSPAVLLIPLAGPWITVGTTRRSAASAVGLTALGIGQAVGLGMLIGGLSMSTEVRVKKERVLQMSAAPLVSPEKLGLELQGAF
jgi:hypothetical protein